MSGTPWNVIMGHVDMVNEMVAFERMMQNHEDYQADDEDKVQDD